MADSLGAPKRDLYRLWANCEQEQEHWDSAADALHFLCEEDRDRAVLAEYIEVSLNRTTLSKKVVDELYSKAYLLKEMDEKLGNTVLEKLKAELKARRL